MRGSGKTYGARRIKDELHDEGLRCSTKRVARLMRLEGLRAQWKKRFRVTTASNHRLPTSPNVLERRFDAERPDTRWVGDITYIPTFEGWLYLSVLLDLHSRRVVGWGDELLVVEAAGDRCTADGPWAARRTARPGPSHGPREPVRIERLPADARPARLRRKHESQGQLLDNAVAESFFATLKKDLVHRVRFRTRAEARSRLFDYIEMFYTRSGGTRP